MTVIAALCGAAAAIRKPLNPARQGLPRLARRSKWDENSEAFVYTGLSFYGYSMQSGSKRQPSAGGVFAFTSA
ncbi:hypothetical protein [Burkholderia sp. 9120]|uniref:hypothetical protein n=1 Tax=Burkholderia sp. 9120 TaxID=1500897 RepID=UPI0005513E01|nr:hypothetical protein [Burkholderia sp. 9120]